MAKIGAKSQGLIRFNRVHPSVLKRVGSQLVLQADPSALLVHIKHDSLLLLGDSPKRSLQLFAAITAQRPQNVSGETRRMHPYQDLLLGGDASPDDSERRWWE